MFVIDQSLKSRRSVGSTRKLTTPEHFVQDFPQVLRRLLVRGEVRFFNASLCKFNRKPSQCWSEPMSFPNPSQSIFLGKIGMLLSGITILVACGGWAIITDWRLGLVSIALLPALVVGMMFQVTFNKMMMMMSVDERSCWICCYCCLYYIALLFAPVVGMMFHVT